MFLAKAHKLKPPTISQHIVIDHHATCNNNYEKEKENEEVKEAEKISILVIRTQKDLRKMRKLILNHFCWGLLYNLSKKCKSRISKRRRFALSIDHKFSV